MELQFGLAIVDELNGGQETRRRMDGWMGREARRVRWLRGRGRPAPPQPRSPGATVWC